MYSTSNGRRRHVGGSDGTGQVQFEPIANSLYVHGSREALARSYKPDLLLASRQVIAETTSAIADEITTNVTRALCRSSIDWLGRALFGDSRTISDVFSEEPVTSAQLALDPTSKDILRFLPLLGRPYETTPYTAVEFEDYTKMDESVDHQRLLYSPVMKDFFPTGPDYWLGRFLRPVEGPHARIINGSPTDRNSRTNQHLDCGLVKRHFILSHEGIMTGLSGWAGAPPDAFVDSFSVILSWAIARSCYQHWLQTLYENVRKLKDFLADIVAFGASLSAAEAAVIQAVIESPKGWVDSNTETARARYRGSKPMAQYDTYTQSQKRLPKDGESTNLARLFVVNNFIANATEELELFTSIFHHLDLAALRAFPAYGLLRGSWPSDRAAAAIQTIPAWMQEALTTGWDEDRWVAEVEQRLEQFQHGQVFFQWSEMLSSLWAEFERHTLQEVRSRQSIDRHLGALLYTGPQSSVVRSPDPNLVSEVVRGLTEVDCSEERRRGNHFLTPRDAIRFHAASSRLLVEMSEPFGNLEGYRNRLDTDSQSLEQVELDSELVFGSVSDYLAATKPGTDKHPVDGRQDWPMGLDMQEYNRVVTAQALEAEHNDATLEERMSEELTRLKNRVNAGQGVSVFTGITETLRLCKTFYEVFGKMDEATAYAPSNLSRVRLALHEIRAKVRIQHAFWGSPNTPVDIREDNLAFWSGLAKQLEEIHVIVTQTTPPKADSWPEIRDLIGDRTRRTLASVVMYTLRMVEDDISYMGDQASVDHHLGQDRVYSVLQRSMDQGRNAAPWNRVVRSKRQKAAQQAMNSYYATERRVKQVRLTERQRTWCRVLRDHLLQFIRSSQSVRVVNVQEVISSLRMTHGCVDQWEQDQLRSLDLDGFSVDEDSEAALRSYARSVPPPFWSHCDILVLSLEVKETDPKHDELVAAIKTHREYTSDLDDLIKTVGDGDLKLVLDGVDSIRQLSSQADSYFMWATFDPMARRPEYDSTQKSHTFFFEVRVYRTLDFYCQWLASLYANGLAHAALEFRRDALRVYEQTPVLGTGQDQPDKTKKDTISMVSPRFYRALYLMQDLGCTASTSLAKRKRQVRRDPSNPSTYAEIHDRDSKDSWIGLQLLCHTDTKAAQLVDVDHRAFSTTYGTWHDALVRFGGHVDRLVKEPALHQVYPTRLIPLPFL